jgi:hypothetical protein
MRSLLLLLAVLAAACGSKVGDACSLSTDCSSDGTRTCDTTQPGGYCTVEGCAYDSCPEEAVCVRFFPGLEDGALCADGNDCGVAEICTISGAATPDTLHCAPRSLERRFCMLACSSTSDCREGYECRGETEERLHGGEPVPSDLGVVPATRFCAPLRYCVDDGDCADVERCSNAYCVLR